MSASEIIQGPERPALAAKLWIGLALLIAAGVALAWFGAGSLRGETTATGVQLRTVHTGTGPDIKPVDGVLLNYEGRLDDGTVFDSTQGRGPAPMIAGQVIPGFAEALSHMQEGGSYRIHIPADQAYGASPPPGSPIPPNADLDFDVEVVKVVPNAALMAAGGAQPQEAPPTEAMPSDAMPSGALPQQP
jgi:FKBP-type peptidyl-prolyl cis-trans isomerase FkpA